MPQANAGGRLCTSMYHLSISELPATQDDGTTMKSIKFLVCLTLALFWELGLTAPKSAQTLTPLPDRVEAPGFKLRDIDGATHQLTDYRGKIVIVNFWATWCPPCREEMPSMQRAWIALREEGIVMLAENVGEDEDTIFKFTADYPVEFSLLMDLDSKVVQRWPVVGLPTTFVLDTKGRLTYRAIGGRAWDHPELLTAVRALKNQD